MVVVVGTIVTATTASTVVRWGPGDYLGGADLVTVIMLGCGIRTLIKEQPLPEVFVGITVQTFVENDRFGTSNPGSRRWFCCSSRRSGLWTVRWVQRRKRAGRSGDFEYPEGIHVGVRDSVGRVGAV